MRGSSTVRDPLEGTDDPLVDAMEHRDVIDRHLPPLVHFQLPAPDGLDLVIADTGRVRGFGPGSSRRVPVCLAAGPLVPGGIVIGVHAAAGSLVVNHHVRVRVDRTDVGGDGRDALAAAVGVIADIDGGLQELDVPAFEVLDGNLGGVVVARHGDE